MWVKSSIEIKTSFEEEEKEQVQTTSTCGYSEDEDTSTDTTGRTVNTIQEQEFLHQEMSVDPFEELMVRNDRVSKYQNTYFMDGGNRFISLPTLGNTNTKAASHLSRTFEEWLQNKLYHQHIHHGLLPILEDSVELLAEDIVNKLKSRHSVKGITGLSRILFKIRTGHVYTYHPLNDGQPLITADMEDFFQQFPLFVEIVIYTMPKDHDHTAEEVQLLLSLENITSNPNVPYYIKQDIV